MRLRFLYTFRRVNSSWGGALQKYLISWLGRKLAQMALILQPYVIFLCSPLLAQYPGYLILLLKCTVVGLQADIFA